ncbi:MAG: FlgT C-terminal domain-containing protein, partial [Pedobacter sp.]
LTTEQLGPRMSIDKEMFQLNRDILKTVISKYPLRGYVMKVSGNEAIINIGSRQGVVSGTRFDVLEEPAVIKFKGRALRSLPNVVGQVEVARVEPDLAYVKFINQQRAVKADDKIQERMNEPVVK